MSDMDMSVRKVEIIKISKSINIMGLEKFLEGQFSLTPSEQDKIKKEAMEKGENPDNALAEEEKKMEQTTGRIREDQREKIIEETGKAIEKELGKE
jgi:hypothetical protein